MKLPTVNGEGTPQNIVVAGVVNGVVDASDSIAVASEAQELFPADPLRQGYFFQNLSAEPMFVNEITDADDQGASHQVLPLGTWPPGANYPIVTGQVTVWCAVAGMKYMGRTWTA